MREALGALGERGWPAGANSGRRRVLIPRDLSSVYGYGLRMRARPSIVHCHKTAPRVGSRAACRPLRRTLLRPTALPALLFAVLTAMGACSEMTAHPAADTADPIHDPAGRALFDYEALEGSAQMLQGNPEILAIAQAVCPGAVATPNDASLAGDLWYCSHAPAALATAGPSDPAAIEQVLVFPTANGRASEAAALVRGDYIAHETWNHALLFLRRKGPTWTVVGAHHSTVAACERLRHPSGEHALLCSGGWMNGRREEVRLELFMGLNRRQHSEVLALQSSDGVGEPVVRSAYFEQVNAVPCEGGGECLSLMLDWREYNVGSEGGTSEYRVDLARKLSFIWSGDRLLPTPESKALLAPLLAGVLRRPLAP